MRAARPAAFTVRACHRGGIRSSSTAHVQRRRAELSSPSTRDDWRAPVPAAALKPWAGASTQTIGGPHEGPGARHRHAERRISQGSLRVRRRTSAQRPQCRKTVFRSPNFGALTGTAAYRRGATCRAVCSGAPTATRAHCRHRSRVRCKRPARCASSTHPQPRQHHELASACLTGNVWFSWVCCDRCCGCRPGTSGAPRRGCRSHRVIAQARQGTARSCASWWPATRALPGLVPPVRSRRCVDNWSGG